MSLKVISEVINELGKLITLEDEDGVTLHRQYNKLNQLISEKTEYPYDFHLEWTWHLNGKMKSFTDHSSGRYRSWDENGKEIK